MPTAAPGAEDPKAVEDISNGRTNLPNRELKWVKLMASGGAGRGVVVALPGKSFIFSLTLDSSPDRRLVRNATPLRFDSTDEAPR